MCRNERFDSHRIDESRYQSIDNLIDNFAKISMVQSDLLFGNKSFASNPVISIILPTYQRAGLFGEALNSILKQKEIDVEWECIVVDNTPLDRNGLTPALKIIIQKNNPLVLYYHNRENIGSGYNWNRGVELARGRWVCFLHDDDILLPDALRNILRIIRCFSGKNKSLGCIQARRFMFSDISQINEINYQSYSYFEELTRMRSLIRGVTGTGAPSCGTTFLKEAYVKCGGINYDYGLTADAVLGYQIMKYYRIVLSDCELGGYRWFDNETVKKNSLQELIHSDYLFACYRYSQNKFSRIWGLFFKRAEYNENIRYKIRDARQVNSELDPSALAKDLKYKKTNLLLFIMYKFLQRAFSCVSVICAMVDYHFRNAQSVY